MRVGVQFTKTVKAKMSGTFYTHGWKPEWHVLWTVMPTTIDQVSPQLTLRVTAERTLAGITYWLTVRNLSDADVQFEARYAIVN